MIYSSKNRLSFNFDRNRLFLFLPPNQEPHCMSFLFINNEAEAHFVVAGIWGEHCLPFWG